MALAVIGVSHRTAPVEVRERFSFTRSEIPQLLASLVEGDAVDEAVLLTTCNRTELYASLPDLQRGEAVLRARLLEHLGGPPEEGARYLYAHRDRAAARHLFRVTAGLDSMVMGEPQIQGQVKEAYQLASEATGEAGPLVGPALNRLFQTALQVGGRVRSETELGVGAASVSTAAVELAKKIFGSLQNRQALVLGAGEMSEVTLECLRAEGVRGWTVANRTYQRAQELAERWCGRAVAWDEVGQVLSRVDLVVCSTAAPHPILTRERLRASLPGGASRPLCIIDIAIPRDVEPSVGDEPNVFLYNIDDLRQIVDDNLGRRRSQIPHAESLVDAGVEEYWSWYSGLVVVPTIRRLREHGEQLRQLEVERALRRLAHLPTEDREAIDRMTRALLNKLLHAPTVRLREAAGNGRGTVALDTVRYLFQLDGQPDPGEGADPAAEPDAVAPEPGTLAAPDR